VIVDSALYLDGVRQPGRFDTTDWRERCGADAFSWTGLFEPTKAEFEQIRLHIDLHDLVVEDALNAHQRPKLEGYGDALFLVLKTAKYLPDTEEVEFGEIQVFVTPHAVLHVRHNAPSRLTTVRANLEETPDILRLGPGAVLHAIVDHVVDDYEPVVSEIEGDVREVERQVFNRHAGQNPVERIYGLMRSVLLCRTRSFPCWPRWRHSPSSATPSSPMSCASTSAMRTTTSRQSRNGSTRCMICSAASSPPT